MNERILELADKAVEDMPSGPWNIPDEFCKKFAELIVQECIAQCEKNKDHEWLGSGSKLSAFNIKEHFGVEE
jgi:hypothetical protein